MLTDMGSSKAHAAPAVSVSLSSPVAKWRHAGAAGHARSPLEKAPSSLTTAFQGGLYACVVVVSLEIIAVLVGQAFEPPYQVLSLLAGLLAYMGLRNLALAGRWDLGRPGSEGNRMLVVWAGIVGVLLMIGYSTQWSEYFSRQVLLLWIAAVPLSLLALNGGARWALGRTQSASADGRRAVMIYANDTARRFASNARRSRTFDVQGYFEDRALDRVDGGLDGVKYLGHTDCVADYVRHNSIEVVFIFLSQLHTQNVRQLLEALGDTTASVYYVPDFKIFDEIETRMISVESVPMVEVVETPFYGVDGFLKQIFDSACALAGLLALSPLLLTVAVLVKLSSEGPVIFRQRRYGLNGREFWIYKFRTMYMSDAGDTSRETVQASRSDARVTPIGRFLRSTSIDELPQLLNVVKGDMSLVGPRPHTVAHNEFYRKSVRHYMLRHKVKPGLTGLAQVNGFRGETAQLELMEQRIRFDLEYIKNWSPWLDIKIILRTVGLVLRRHNAY